MNQQEELVLKILSSVDVIQGKTKFVKILHLVCKLLEKNQIKHSFSFKPDNYGVNSQELVPVLQNLKNQGMIKMTSTSSERSDLSLANKNYLFDNEIIIKMSSRIKSLVQALNQYSSDEIIAISYHFFPETTTKSQIKPRINKKITEMFSELNPDFEEFSGNEVFKSISSETQALYPQFNDLDVRVHMMKSLGLTELPPIIPDIIDESFGLFSKKTSFFKDYDLEKMLENARRR